MSAYRDTLNLSHTEFPMRGNLPAREPETLARWDRLGLYARIRASRKARAVYPARRPVLRERCGLNTDSGR